MGRESRLNPATRTTRDVVDAIGRPLHEGDEVLLVTPQRPFLFKIEDISPEVDPRSQVVSSGQIVRVTFRCTAVFVAAYGARNPEFLLVRTVEEIAPPPLSPARDTDEGGG